MHLPPTTLTLLLTLYLLLTTSPCTSTNFPIWQQNSPPYTDACAGLSQVDCGRNKLCTWSTSQSPCCVGKQYIKVVPPSKWAQVPIPLVNNFFEFTAGVHLAEGTYQKFYYNTDVEQCARSCLGSAAGAPDPPTFGSPVFGTPEPQWVQVRCLSFDFFPFESPMTEAPYKEAQDRGICILNSAYSLNARLRNEDESLTDAELFYSSYYERRPFSAYDGHYKVRDTRGSGLASLLNYDGSDPSLKLGDLIRAWGASRWGSVPISVPDPLQPSLSCGTGHGGPTGGSAPTHPPTGNSMYVVAFTPVDENQKCPGLVTKTDAEQMCKWAGGQLCDTQQEITQTLSIKLGCSFDQYAMWSAADVSSGGQTKYPRCCGVFQSPFSCGLYTTSNINRCSSYLTATDCLWEGSGTMRQTNFGFGNAMLAFRTRCSAANSNGVSCQNLLIQTWTPRDACIWCPTTGTAAGGGSGICRPGNDFGICPKADPTAQNALRLNMLSQCSPTEICGLVAAYPELSQVLLSGAISG